MKLQESSLAQIKTAVLEATSPYKSDNELLSVTDIHFQVNPTSGELVIMDDSDTILGGATIAEWADDKGKGFDGHVQRTLTALLEKMHRAGEFDGLNLMKPYSFVLVDGDKETIAELLLIDDETLILNNELLAGLDDELNDFLRHLLEE